jgi:hypothetical protein
VGEIITGGGCRMILLEGFKTAVSYQEEGNWPFFSYGIFYTNTAIKHTTSLR